LRTAADQAVPFSAAVFLVVDTEDPVRDHAIGHGCGATFVPLAALSGISFFMD
jgi:hypothetical protein